MKDKCIQHNRHFLRTCTKTKILTTVDYIRMISVMEGAVVGVGYEKERKQIYTNLRVEPCTNS